MLPKLDPYNPNRRLLWSLVAALLVVRLTDHPLVAVALLFPIVLTIWVWP